MGGERAVVHFGCSAFGGWGSGVRQGRWPEAANSATPAGRTGLTRPADKQVPRWRTPGWRTWLWESIRFARSGREIRSGIADCYSMLVFCGSALNQVAASDQRQQCLYFAGPVSRNISLYFSHGACAVLRETGNSFHVRPSSIRPPDFDLRPPHCFQKKATECCSHSILSP